MLRDWATAIVRLPPSFETVVLAMIGALSSTILLKIANIQYLELVELVLLGYVLFRICRTDFRFELSRGLFRIVSGYAVFVLLIVFGCGLAFTRPFYFDGYGLNRPGFVSAARLLELILGIFATVVLSEVFRRSPAKCLFTGRIFWYTGTLSAALSLTGVFLSGPFLRFTAGKRASGFYNEGGPYGLFILSVILLGWAFLRLSPEKRPALLKTGIVIDAAALLLSASKAAYIAVVLLLIVEALYAGGFRQKVFTFSTMMLLITLAGIFTPANKGIAAYIEGGQKFEVISQLRPDDINFSYGRVAALFFVPRMIGQHPLTGVGLGNYGLVRNAPEYRGNAAAATLFVDHDGLGLAGVAAEIGLPAVALLIYLLVQPAVLARRLTHSKAILALAFLQPVVHLCGAQLNVTYPWIVSALALGMAGLYQPLSSSATLQGNQAGAKQITKNVEPLHLSTSSTKEAHD